MLSLQQRLSLQQKLSPQQIQYQKLLQLNTIALEQRIKTELELNPILEETLMDDYELEQEQMEDNPDTGDEAVVEEDLKNSDDEFDVEDFMNDSDIDSELSYEKLNKSNDEEKTFPVAPQKRSLRENLIEQLHMLELDEDEIFLGENIINSLNKDGYFKDDLERIVNDLRLFEDIEISKEKAEKVLEEIQKLDPVGIGTRDLRECLLVQIRL